MTWTTYALDAKGYDETGDRCWVPLEDDGTLALGMNYISDMPPDGCTSIAVFHEDGQGACDEWCAKHGEELEEIRVAVGKRQESLAGNNLAEQ